jgi:hypothetical protein
MDELSKSGASRLRKEIVGTAIRVRAVGRALLFIVDLFGEGAGILPRVAGNVPMLALFSRR